MGFFFLLLPAAIFYLNSFSFWILGIAAFVGVFYSLSFRIGKKVFRLKNIFLIKNVLIGLIWGALVLIGAETVHKVEVQSLFIFCVLQVFIGSMTRDIPDIEKDKESGVKSLPVILGVPTTLFIMRLVNISSLGAAYILDWNQNWLIVYTLIIMWRMISLIYLGKNHSSIFWSQTANLLTCIFIPFILFALLGYGITS